MFRRRQERKGGNNKKKGKGKGKKKGRKPRVHTSSQPPTSELCTHRGTVTISEGTGAEKASSLLCDALNETAYAHFDPAHFSFLF